MSKHAVQGTRHAIEIQRLDEQGGPGLDLAAAPGSHEAPELFLCPPASPRGLLLEGAERCELTLSVDDPFDGGGAEAADQLVLEVCLAHVEAESLHVGASEVGAEPGPLERAMEVALLPGVAETRQLDVEACGP